MKDELLPATGHIADGGQIVKEPTYTTTGEKAYYCTKCGAVVRTETIEKKSIPELKSLEVSKVITSAIKLSIGKVDGELIVLREAYALCEVLILLGGEDSVDIHTGAHIDSIVFFIISTAKAHITVAKCEK